MPACRIALLTHAPSDLAMMSKALEALPGDFPQVAGFNLQTVESHRNLSDLISTELTETKVLVIRVLGRVADITAFSDLLANTKERHQNILVISGTGEPDPELAGMSNVPVDVLQQVQEYFQAGGAKNIEQLLRYLADHFLLTGYGWQPAVALPEHGIYHPDLGGSASIEDWLQLPHRERPAIGINFYRAHWMSGNTQFIDALVRALEAQGLNALPVYTSSLKELSSDTEEMPAALKFFWQDGKCIIDVLINTTSFAAGDAGAGSGGATKSLALLDVPVLQAITSTATKENWQESSRGLNPMDTAMNVVMPEFDGRIITVPVSFKSNSASMTPDTATYVPAMDRASRVAKIAARMVTLRRIKNSEKRIAFILTNSNAKASQVGNAVGLDAPASLIQILDALTQAGYSTGNYPPGQDGGDRLIHDLIDRLSYDRAYISEQQYRQAIGKVDATAYARWFEELPDSLREKMLRQWGTPPGEAYSFNHDLVIAGLEYGNIMVALQPPRGYGMDPDAIYHTPDLAPTHHYYAMYRWLKDVWGAHAIVHVGKHGTLEWLPGKGVGLSEDCFPDAVLEDMPLFYPFIINDPGEGAQAKRRAHAVIIDHLTPAMTSAETYGVLADLVHLVDEYYQMESLDPGKLPLLQRQIWDLIKKANLESDIGLILTHDHDDEHDEENEDSDHNHDHDQEDVHHHDEQHQHDHEWKSDLTEHGVPETIAEMDGVAVSHLIQTIDGYLCELGMAEIRDGLHTFGCAPQDRALTDMLCSLTRLPNLNVPGLHEQLARLLGITLGELQKNKGARVKSVTPTLRQLAGKDVFTNADVLEVIGTLSHQIYESAAATHFDPQNISNVIRQVLGTVDGTKEIQTILKFACEQLVPNIQHTGQEIDNLLRALEGKYIESGPSGAPTRGMAHILPTGRNFYSVDPRSLPSHSAWLVGQQLADQVVLKHLKDAGVHPESVSISVWGTSAMRTHGDDVAQILALFGVRPVWQSESHRVADIEVIPMSELKRPRVDVTVRISGFFRDAFPHIIDLISTAVNKIVMLDESPEQNFVRKHYLEELAQCVANGMDEQEAERRSRYRIFGSKPGSYGAGILHLINEKNWANEHDFAQAYINWGGYAYSQNEYGVEAREDFKKRLMGVKIALHNQDNREHDIFDSDDYLQFHGGMIATIRSLTGQRPRHYFGDTHDPGNASVRDLKEEALRVHRSRVVNPKWLTAIQRHGYKGGLELVSTVDYFFGYDATTDIMEDWMYEDVAQNYALSEEVQKFLAEHNPWALNAIAERLLEAAQRKMWKDPKEETLDALKQLFLDSEAGLEARSEMYKQEAT